MKKINLPILPATLFFLCKEEEYDKYLKGIDLRSAYGEPLGYPGEDCAVTIGANTPNGYGIIVALGPYENIPDDRVRSILVHEAVHIKQFVLEACNEDKPGIEVEAYLIQYYSNVLIDAFYSERLKEEKKKNKSIGKKKAH